MKYIRWDEYYAVAEDLHKKIGTINVPANYIYKGYPIGEWISRQRGIERKNGLKSVRKKKLEKLNIVWDGRKVNEEKRHADFLLMYSILKKYYDTYGKQRSLLRTDALKCPPRCSGQLQRNIIFIFAGPENLRIFRTCPFTREDAAKNVS